MIKEMTDDPNDFKEEQCEGDSCGFKLDPAFTGAGINPNLGTTESLFATLKDHQMAHEQPPPQKEEKLKPSYKQTMQKFHQRRQNQVQKKKNTAKVQHENAHSYESAHQPAKESSNEHSDEPKADSTLQSLLESPSKIMDKIAKM